MALKNAFEDIATEETLSETKVDQVTIQRELLTDILLELKRMNTYLSLMTDEEISIKDIS